MKSVKSWDLKRFKRLVKTFGDLWALLLIGIFELCKALRSVSSENLAVFEP